MEEENHSLHQQVIQRWRRRKHKSQQMVSEMREENHSLHQQVIQLEEEKAQSQQMVSEMREENHGLQQQFNHEMSIAAKLSHPNLLLFIGAIREEKLVILPSLCPPACTKSWRRGES